MVGEGSEPSAERADGTWARGAGLQVQGCECIWGPPHLEPGPGSPLEGGCKLSATLIPILPPPRKLGTLLTFLYSEVSLKTCGWTPVSSASMVAKARVKAMAWVAEGS